ncbi:MAG TPA: sigma-70 family RNA polymerase sigma factor [Thermoanaerobaculia bacterium]|nr:sigma-70 family RNA polymerase sigma factor [Thermoanaerobaculia bacterium]
MSDADAAIQAIVADLQAGRAVEEGFRLLCERFHRPVYRFFARRGFPEADCFDLTQETFLGIYRGIGSFRRDAPFTTWLFKVATNAYRKRLRLQGAGKRAGYEVPLSSQPEEEDDRPAFQPVAPGPLPEASLLQAERARLLREAVHELPDQMRKCLILNVYHELKMREIGQLLHLSPETVKVHLFQARRRLHKALGPLFASSMPDGGEASS